MENLARYAVEIALAVIAILGSTLGAVIAARAQLRRVSSENRLDESTTAMNYQKLAADQAEKTLKLQKQMDENDAEFRRRLQELEHIINGPFRATIDFVTHPKPEILHMEIRLLPADDNVE